MCMLFIAFPLARPGLYALTVGATVNGAAMVVSGQADPGQQVSIVAQRDDGKRCYVGQTSADNTGRYSISFSLDKGTYQARVASGGQQAETQKQVISQSPGSGSITDPSVITPTSDKVYISVKGDTAAGVILPSTAWPYKANCSILQALRELLDSQGISYVVDSQGYVNEIGGLREKKPGYPLSGWVCKLNGQGLSSGAGNIDIKKDNVIEWLYTLDGGKDVGIEQPLPEQLGKVDEQVIQQLTTMINAYDSKFADLKGCSPINADQRMTGAEAAALQQKLMNNQVTCQKTMTPQGGLLYDAQQEIILSFPPNAINSETVIAVQEQAGNSGFNDKNYQPYSPVYHLQPDGSKFNGKVRMVIKLSLPAELKTDDLSPAFYDEKSNKWEALPGVIDLKNGLVIFDTSHFSYFAVVDKTKTPAVPVSQAKSSNTFDYSEVERDYPWALAAIKALSSQGIMVGSEHGFDPGRVITRVELAALLQRSLKSQSSGGNIELKDVPASAWYYSVMQTAVKSGWISGYPDKTYHPEAVVNRYEAAAMLFKARSGAKAGAGKNTCSDYGQAPAWVQPALSYMAAEGLMNGYPDGTFGGEKPMNRAQAAVIIWGMLNDQ